MSRRTRYRVSGNKSLPVKKKILASLVMGFLLRAAAPQAGAQSAVPAAAPVATTLLAAEITVSLKPVAAISPLLYGVNYTWHTVPAERFPAWHRAMSTVAHYTLVQYPGGWNPEHFDWTANSMPAWHNPKNSSGFDPLTNQPGIAPEGMLAVAPAANFVTPSQPAVLDPAAIPGLVATSVELARRYGARVKLWDIGNEWWIQRGGQKIPAIRKQNLRNYSALVAAVAPAMKAANPSIQLYANGDWQNLEEFTTIRQLVGPEAWAQLDGIAIHTYCNGQDAPVSSVPMVVEKLRQITGKQRVFDSQWMITQKGFTDNYGIRNANRLVLGFQALAFARIEAAIIWPVTDFVPALNFVSPDYATPYAPGLLFGWMSQYYQGQALRTEGDLPATAAKSEHGVTVFVPSCSDGPRRVSLRLAGTGSLCVVSAKVMYSDQPGDRLKSRLVRIVDLPTAVVEGPPGPAVVFTLNPGGPNRGTGWEIVRLTLHEGGSLTP